jgi:DNA modification methylase
MSNPRPPRRKPIEGALGITPALQRKSKTRREKQHALTEITARTPKLRNDLLPQLSIVRMPIDALTPAARRVRRSEEVQIERVRASIEKFGICAPILIGADRRIVHGHIVWEAARRIGLSEVPAIIVDHLTPDERRALSIALNRLGETGVWDEEMLACELEELIDAGEDVLVTGFEEAEIDALLLPDDDPQADEEENIPVATSPAISKLGDLWKLGDHLLKHGDARDPASYAALFDDGEQARLVLTDEPYNVPNVGHVTSNAGHREFAMAAGEMSPEEFAQFNRAWMTAATAHLMEGGLCGTFIDWRSVGLVLAMSEEVGLVLLNFVVWVKSNAGQGSLWRSRHELLPIFKKGDAAHVNNVELGRHGRWRSNVWFAPGASSLGSDAREGLAQHPTVKPRALLEDALLDVTRRGEIVLDPFGGSGSTLIAAESVGRVCRAIEIDGPYCDVIIRRWQEVTGEAAVLAASGETFAEISARARLNAENEDACEGGR